MLKLAIIEVCFENHFGLIHAILVARVDQICIQFLGHPVFSMPKCQEIPRLRYVRKVVFYF